jgi:hypothetical protein
MRNASTFSAMQATLHVSGIRSSLETRAHHQHGFRRASGRHLGFRRSSIGEEFRGPRSKLCNILFTRELARRLQGTGVTAHCLHPGFVATRFGDQSGGPIAHVLWLAKFFAISPARGAETIVYLASSPDVPTTTGHYFYKCLPTTPSAAARAHRSALLLWQRSAVLAGLKENGSPPL